MRLRLRYDPQGSAPGDRLGAILDRKFGEYIASVDLDRMQRDIKPGSDVLIGQPFGDELKHFEFARAEWLNQFGVGTPQQRRCSLLRFGNRECCQQPRSVLSFNPVRESFIEQASHRDAFVDKDTDVSLRLGKRQGTFQWNKRSRDVALRLLSERLQHQDL